MNHMGSPVIWPFLTYGHSSFVWFPSVSSVKGLSLLRKGEAPRPSNMAAIAPQLGGVGGEQLAAAVSG